MKKHKCAICGKYLHGFSNKGSKTQNRPTRAFPNLCLRCNDRVVRLAKRLKNNEIKPLDVEIRYSYYVNLMRDRI